MKTSALCLVLASAALGAAAPLDSQFPFSPPRPLEIKPQAVRTHKFPSLVSLGLPPSLLEQLDAHLNANTEKRLIQLDEDAEPVEITEGEKAFLTMAGKRFIDVTDEVMFMNVDEKELYPGQLTYNASLLEPLFDDISTKDMKTFLTKFTSFRTRYYRSQTGRDSQVFLMKTLKEIAATNPKANVTITEFPHAWGQNSIIIRFEPRGSVKSDDGHWRLGRNKGISEKIVILGAHQDSTNLLPFLAAPGADDDGSGTTTLVSAFTSLIKASFSPSTNPVEFHFYSAEEGGLLGSQAVAQEYARLGRQIRGMLQMDMTAWVKTGTTPVIGLITDFVDPDLTELLRKLVKEYAEIDSVDTKCGYACSDHASWSKVGAPSAFTIESTFEDSNHNIHSSNDRIDFSSEFSFDHMAQFARIAIGMAVELGGGRSVIA